MLYKMSQFCAANGTTGEGNNMSVEERKAMAEAWVKAGKGK